MAVGEDDVAEEAGQLVGGGRDHDRIEGAGEDFARIIFVEQQGSEAVARILIGPVVDRQPAPVGQDRLRAGPDARGVPVAGAGPGEALVLPPVLEIRGASQPDKGAADVEIGRPVQGQILPADFLREQGTVLV